MSSAVGGSRRSFYYTMNYDDEADLDDPGVVSPNRNRMAADCQFFRRFLFSGFLVAPGNTKGESITVPLTSCLTDLDQSVLKIKTKIVSCHKADSKRVKQEVNGTVILPPLVFPGGSFIALSQCILKQRKYFLYQKNSILE